MAHLDLLISVDELLSERNSPHGPHLLDVRWKLGGPPGGIAYADGHLPGAIFVDLDRDLSGERGPGGSGGRHPLPAAAAFQSAMRALGVHDHQPVVVYDGDDSTAAARAWWLLRYFGHPSVRVLDGGFRAWQLAGLAPETGPPAAPPLPGTFTAQPGHLPLLDAAGAAALAREGVLLDARAAERYRGEVEPVDPVAGHIPGAVSAPTAENVNPGGMFRSAGELTERFAGLGITGEHAVGAYCGSGVTAAHEVLALALAGITAGLYAGSWSDWITDPARPIGVG